MNNNATYLHTRQINQAVLCKSFSLIIRCSSGTKSVLAIHLPITHTVHFVADGIEIGVTGEVFLGSLGYYTAAIFELYMMNALGNYLVESNTYYLYRYLIT